MKKNSIITEKEIMSKLKKNRETLDGFSVRKIGVFGSVVRGENTRKSDVDMIVDFKKPTFDNFMELSFYLERLLGRKIDLVTKNSVDPAILDRIKKEVHWHAG